MKFNSRFQERRDLNLASLPFINLSNLHDFAKTIQNPREVPLLQLNTAETLSSVQPPQK